MTEVKDLVRGADRRLQFFRRDGIDGHIVDKPFP